MPLPPRRTRRPGRSGARPMSDATPLTYEEAKTRAGSHDVAVRRDLAGRRDLPPELIYFLAADPDTEVREAVAANRRTPVKANQLLVGDGQETVRVHLAEKLVQELSDPQEVGAEANRSTESLLVRLACDQLPLVRKVLSEALRSLPNAPHEVVQRLAHDVENGVAVPVLENSPVLTDDDLIAAVARAPASGATAAVARRPNLVARVSDAVVASGRKEAITDLLNNKSAQIREETLEELVDGARHVPQWQGPLVRRPVLPAPAARKMAHYVADDLLRELTQRADLPQDTVHQLKEVVHQRLEQSQRVAHAEVVADAAAGTRKWEETQDSPPARRFTDADGRKDLHEVAALNAQNKLSENRLVRAAQEGREGFVLAGLSLLSGMGLESVRDILNSGNSRAVCALAWKAGLRARFAYMLQVRMAGIPPREAIKPDHRDGYVPSASEMSWHLAEYQKN